MLKTNRIFTQGMTPTCTGRTKVPSSSQKISKDTVMKWGESTRRQLKLRVTPKILCFNNKYTLTILCIMSFKVLSSRYSWWKFPTLLVCIAVSQEATQHNEKWVASFRDSARSGCVCVCEFRHVCVCVCGFEENLATVTESDGRSVAYTYCSSNNATTLWRIKTST